MLAYLLASAIIPKVATLEPPEPLESLISLDTPPANVAPSANGITATGVPAPVSVPESVPEPVLESVPVPADDGDPLTIRRNYAGWVNPEDLMPMPQCVTEQDETKREKWLELMTKCTSKRCTSRFGAICTHHQWLIHLSCLASEFSPDAIEPYVPYCSRSILAKAQLYHWIRSTTGRTWLVDVGDANELEVLSPASLVDGYASMNVIHKAPVCLKKSHSTPSMESFGYVMQSCAFTGYTEHAGNTARPWEYQQSLRSIVPLASDTVGYDLTGTSLEHGSYFDKECFCSFFAAALGQEPCLAYPGPDLTRERLWLDATCGEDSLPHDWRESLQLFGYEYLEPSKWFWPLSTTSLPRRVMELPDTCATHACHLDSQGYCEVAPAIDMTCACSNISYSDCQGSCRYFENRIDYVNWLNDLCGYMEDWHGLPTTWWRLAAPSARDMIPWRWLRKQNDDSDSTDQCASEKVKLLSIALLNVASLLAVFIGKGYLITSTAAKYFLNAHWCDAYVRGVLIAAPQILANIIIGVLMQRAVGYQDTPVLEAMLLWCTMPQLGWLAMFVTGAHEIELMDFSSALSFLTAEIILQAFCLYSMLTTVIYGLSHNLYFADWANAERGQSARAMYVGALLWLIVFILWIRKAIIALRSWAAESDADAISTHSGTAKSSTSWPSTAATRGSEAAPLTKSTSSTYGTVPTQRRPTMTSSRVLSQTYTTIFVTTLLLWVSRWLFWIGFIGISSAT